MTKYPQMRKNSQNLQYISYATEWFELVFNN